MKSEVTFVEKSQSLLKRAAIALAIPLVLYLIYFIAAPSSVGWGNFVEMLRQSIAAAILSWGMVYGLKIGIWNYSVGASVMFAAIYGGNIAVRLNLGVFPTIVLIAVTGALLGFVTGFLFIALKIPSVILTIGMMVILESATAVAFGGGGITMMNDILKLSLFPYDTIVFVILFVIAYILMYKLSIGYNLRAVGNNIAAAKLNGINIDATRIICFTITGFFCGCYAVMAIGKSGVITPRVNMDSLSITFDALIGGFIGIALEKQVNLILGVYIGSLSIQLIKTCIIAYNFPSVFQQAIIAVFLLVIISATTKSPLTEALGRLKKQLIHNRETVH